MHITCNIHIEGEVGGLPQQNVVVYVSSMQNIKWFQVAWTNTVEQQQLNKTIDQKTDSPIVRWTSKLLNIFELNKISLNNDTIEQICNWTRPNWTKVKLYQGVLRT